LRGGKRTKEGAQSEIQRQGKAAKEGKKFGGSRKLEKRISDVAIRKEKGDQGVSCGLGMRGARAQGKKVLGEIKGMVTKRTGKGGEKGRGETKEDPEKSPCTHDTNSRGGAEGIQETCK